MKPERKNIALALLLALLICPAPLFLAEETICFEAEDAAEIVKPLMIGKDNEKMVAKGRFIEIKQGAGEGEKAGGKAAYKLNFKTDGQYWLWARVWWPDSCGNSFSVALDQGPAFTFGNDNTYNSWHWVKAMVKLDLKKGPHLLTVSNREDGIRIDQFLLTNDDKLVPVEIENSVKPAE